LSPFCLSPRVMWEQDKNNGDPSLVILLEWDRFCFCRPLHRRVVSKTRWPVSPMLQQ